MKCEYNLYSPLYKCNVKKTAVLKKRLKITLAQGYNVQNQASHPQPQVTSLAL